MFTLKGKQQLKIDLNFGSDAVGDRIFVFVLIF